MSILFGVVLCACLWAQRGGTMTVYAEVPTWHPTAVYDDGTRCRCSTTGLGDAVRSRCATVSDHRIEQWCAATASEHMTAYTHTRRQCVLTWGS